jgi:hypothetical protein
LSETNEGSLGKPKRKIWKIIALIIVVAILTPELMYIYAYSTIEDVYSKSWGTLNLPEFNETMLESTEVTVELTIHNPTSTSIQLVSVNMGCKIDGNVFAIIRETDLYLPAGGSTTLTATFYYSPQIMNSIMSPSYERTIIVANEVSANILFIPITRSFAYENTETVYPG